jgi:hypothetical protein
LAISASSAGDDKKNIKPTQHWGGKNGDDAKKKAAPKSGYLTSQESFETLWKAFGVKGDAPKIDFKKQIVFVQLASGPNNIGTSYTLDGKGNLTALSRQTLIGGPGFGYGLDVLDREGIKSYNGKPIE